MATRSSEGITQLLKKWSNGDAKALDQLMPLVYDELHRLAEAYLRRERREHTLQPTALVNELFLKFFDQNSMSWQNRAQFFGIAAQLMRRILVDHARAHYSAKRGGDRFAVSLKDVAAFGAQPDADLLALHDVLNRLEEIDPTQGRIVSLPARSTKFVYPAYGEKPAPTTFAQDRPILVKDDPAKAVRR